MDRSMDRDRDRRREPDIPIEDRFGTGRGQSYRPGNARERTPPPRMAGESYRARSPPRRAGYPMGGGDSYRAPQRPRSRSPPRREDFRRRTPSPQRYRDREAVPRGGDSYRARPRSPPVRREELPRDDLFRREPARDDFRDTRDFRDDRDRGYAAGGVAARSPLPRFRERSPLPLKRGRDPSPVSSRGRRTPPIKRDNLPTPQRPRYDDFPPSRAGSPPRRRFSPDSRDRRPSPARNATRDFRMRSRSPLPRNDRVDPRAVDNWRQPPPRSPARQPRQGYMSREESSRESGTNSRRSSPPVHPSRMALRPGTMEEGPDSRASPRDPYESRDPYRAPEPESIPRSAQPAQPSYQEDRNYSNAEPAEPTYRDDRDYPAARDPVPPPREPRRLDDGPAQRAPPTGPSGPRAPAASLAPPTGPAAASSLPAASRQSVVPPSGPRGAPAPRGDFAPRGRGFGGDYAPRGRGGFGGDFAPRGRGGFGGDFAPRGRGGFGRGGGDSGAFSRGGGDAGGYSRGGGDAGGYSRGGGESGAYPRGVGDAGSFPQRGSDAGSYGRGGGDMGGGLQRTESLGQESNTTSRPPPSGPRSSFSQATPATWTRPAPTPGNPPAFPRAHAIPDVPTGPKAGRRPNDAALASVAANRVHPAIADLPKIIEGGLKAEPLIDRSKLTKLEDEAERLRRQIEEKEARKRKNLREWDRLTRDTEAAALRSELAEQALKMHNGEAESQAAF